MPEVKNYERQRRYERKKASELADVGEIPAVANIARREKCRLDLLAFLVTYFPMSTGLKPFSPDHHRVISRIQHCLLEGGRLVEAVFRGWAKTTIAENTALWATLYGHRKFIPIFGSDAGAAEGNIDSLKLELSENDLLYDDFPEVCHPIRCLEGKPQRCASQTHTVEGPCTGCGGNGCAECEGTGRQRTPKSTHIEWTADTIVLPTIAGSVASGAIMTAKGLTACSRGMKHKRPDGTQQRPDFVFLDDPQTDESAASPMQVNKRLDLIRKSILKLGGHTRQIAVVMAATVIQPDDVVDQLLDAKKNPAWQGERIPMVRQWPKGHETLWLGEYARLRTSYDADVPGSQKIAHDAATEYYRQNRPAMDADGVISWEHCFAEGELSALQHAYNSYIDDGPEVFASEFQNQPMVKNEGSTDLKPAGVIAKAVKVLRRIAPQYASHLTAFIDVQDKLLYAGVCGWGPGFRGQVIDYRMYPDQQRAYLAYRDVKVTLASKLKGASKEATIRAGLDALSGELLGQVWKREDGVEMRIGLCMVDAGDGDHSDIVYEFCRRSPFSAVLRPSKGRYVGASSFPWEQYPLREGEQLGHHWLSAPLPKARATRLTHFDTNYWKTFLHHRLLAAVGDPSGLELFEGNHAMLADHLTAEYSVKTEGRGRQVTEWKARPGRDNHLFDCIVGCCVGASILGVTMGGAMHAGRKKIRLSEIQKARRG